MCYQLSSRKVDAIERDKLGLIRRRSNQVDNTSELRRSTAVVYHR